MEYTIISPDGFPITDIGFETQEEAEQFAKKWVKGFKEQGYYSTIQNGERVQIPYNEILNHCKLREIEISDYSLSDEELDSFDDEPF